MSISKEVDIVTPNLFHLHKIHPHTDHLGLQSRGALYLLLSRGSQPGDDSGPQDTFGLVWSNFWLLQLRVLLGEGSDTSRHPTRYRTAHHPQQRWPIQISDLVIGEKTIRRHEGCLSSFILLIRLLT